MATCVNSMQSSVPSKSVLCQIESHVQDETGIMIEGIVEGDNIVDHRDSLVVVTDKGQRCRVRVVGEKIALDRTLPSSNCRRRPAHYHESSPIVCQRISTEDENLTKDLN